MEHNLFKPKTLEEGKHAVVGDCNGFTMQQRWEAETPIFARVIRRYLTCCTPEGKSVLDYGCGVGRLAKAVLENRPDITLVGVDASSDMLKQAKEYVGNARFIPLLPFELDTYKRKFNVAYCVYVLQHAPSIEIREILARIHNYLEDDGIFIYCSSDYRMAIRHDGQGFFDDRFLGVNLQEEVGRYFEKIGPLFAEEDYKDNVILKKMITGEGQGLPHPAFVYKKKKIENYFNIPPVNYRVEEKPIVVKTQEEAIVSMEARDKKDYTKIVLTNRLAPGDILVMTNAIRDLHKSYPGKYQLDIRTPCNALFDNNPYVTRLQYDEAEFNKINLTFSNRTHAENDALIARIYQGEEDLINKLAVPIGDVLIVDMHYPMIHSSGACGWHFGYGHQNWLEKILQYFLKDSSFKIKQTDIHPELYLTQSEETWVSPVLAECGYSGEYWILNAGSKGDFTLKQYPYYQQVVDLLKDKVKFIQIGMQEHSHNNLEGTLSMVGKTNNLRNLLRVFKHAQGVVTCVSLPMHIAAAMKKPCVVVAGAREGTRWELYPEQQFLYVNGCLPCATMDGCWRSKIEECTNKVDGYAKCLNLIKPQDIVRGVERYYEGGILTY